MTQEQLFQRLGVALAVGLLIGLERGWRAREEREGERTAGLRTHALSGLLGGVTGALAPTAGAMTVGLAFFGFTLATTAFHWMEAQAEKDVSVTGTVAGMLSFMLGAFAVMGDPLVASAVGVMATLLLALKEPLHGWLRRLTWIEVRSVLVLLAMTFLLLPVLPDRTIDPWDSINPARIWWLAIMLSTISFAGYVAIKVVGDRGGVAVASALGGLTSSTATTMTLAGLSRDAPAASGLLAGGAILAGAIMVARVWFIAFLINPALAPSLAWPLGAAAVVQAVGAALLLGTGGGPGKTPALAMANPFELGMAIKLAALIAAIGFLAKVVATRIGEAGIHVLSAVSGLADVDAITLSMAKLAQGQIPHAVAAAAIGVAIASNTLVKTVMAWSIGGPRMGIRMAVTGLAALAAGAIAFWMAGL